MKPNTGNRIVVYMLVIVSAVIAFCGTCTAVNTGIGYAASFTPKDSDLMRITFVISGMVLGVVFGWKVAKLVATRLSKVFE